MFYSKAANFLHHQYATEAGVFRHGQLVVMSVTVRSNRKSQIDPRFPAFSRAIEVGLRGITLVSREAEIVSIGPRQRSYPN